MMAMTTNNSISVNPLNALECRDPELRLRLRLGSEKVPEPMPEGGACAGLENG